jgi:hypothetical protein
MKIKEPRIRRLIYFFIYILLTVIATITLFFRTPDAFVHVLGGTILVYFSGALIVIGALVCAFSVLPGIWMFERAGLVAIASGIAMYSMFLIVLGASAMVAVVPAIFILFFALRWLDIWEYLLAPKEG